jgi:hypothetical protein
MFQLTEDDAKERIESLAIQCESIETFTSEAFPEAAALLAQARALLDTAAAQFTRKEEGPK